MVPQPVRSIRELANGEILLQVMQDLNPEELFSFLVLGLCFHVYSTTWGNVDLILWLFMICILWVYVICIYTVVCRFVWTRCGVLCFFHVCAGVGSNKWLIISEVTFATWDDDATWTTWFRYIWCYRTTNCGSAGSCLLVDRRILQNSLGSGSIGL